jgi:hypothetical protein
VIVDLAAAGEAGTAIAANNHRRRLVLQLKV